MPFSGGHLLLIILLLGIGLVIFGPKRLPEIGHGMGRAIREFKTGVTELHTSATQTAAAPDQPAPAAPSLAAPAPASATDVPARGVAAEAETRTAV